MGYNIYIGEAVLEDNKADLDVHYIVKAHEEPSAPAFPGDTNPRCNYRWPSYTVWANTLQALGLVQLFKEELMRSHSGICRITPEHLEKVSAAVAAYQLVHPDTEPGWNPSPDGFSAGEGPFTDKSAVLARGLWLEWWMRWALNTAADKERHYGKDAWIPAIYNS